MAFEPGLPQQQRAGGQIEQQGDHGHWRANHRHAGVVTEDGAAEGFSLHDVHVLGPLRATKVLAYEDLRKFKECWQQGRATLFEQLRLASGRPDDVSDGTRRTNLREWSVQVEIAPSGGRRARAAFLIHDGAAWELYGGWRRLRSDAECDLTEIMNAYIDDGIEEALEAAWATEPPSIIVID